MTTPLPNPSYSWLERFLLTCPQIVVSSSGYMRSRYCEQNSERYRGAIVSQIKLIFYCVNTSYPMDNCFTSRRDRSHQMPEKDVLYRIPAGPVRRAHSPGGASYFLFLCRHHDVIASFSFGAWRVKTCFQQGIFGFIPNSTAFFIFEVV